MSPLGRSQQTRMTPRSLAVTGDNPLTPSKNAYKLPHVCVKPLPKYSPASSVFWSGVLSNIMGAYIFSMACPSGNLQPQQFETLSVAKLTKWEKSNRSLNCLKCFIDAALIELTLFIFSRSDEKAEGEGKDGKGEKCGIILSLYTISEC